MKLPKYKRVLLKLSGEALMGANQSGYDYEFINAIATDIKQSIELLGIELCIVVGGGNIYRGRNASLNKMDRVVADHIGMLSTVINALTIQNTMENLGVSSRVLSAIPMESICEPYIRSKAKFHIEKKRMVIFAAGTGSPFFTTDSAAVLRAVEMGCELLLKGTQVDGVYDSDPIKNPSAKKYEKITYSDILKDNLQIMDLAAIAIAKENNLPIKVFSIKERGNLLKVLQGEGSHTEIHTGI